MAWLCLKDNKLSGSQMCIATGPRIDLAITLIDRLKRLFTDKVLVSTFTNKEIIIELNGVGIEAPFSTSGALVISMASLLALSSKSE